MPPSSSLQYQPLDSDTRQKPIRLLELLPSRTAATIQCRLIHTFLIDQPFYEALSYCWGDESNQVTIQCDTRAITVTQNLYAALVRLRKKQKIRTLWVDAICINQKDNSERTQQVRQMTDVYRYADQTLVWLGPGNGQTKKAFQLVPYLLNAHMAFDGGQPFFFSPHLKRRLTHPAFGALQNQRHLYGAFRQLDRLPYFSRLWIVQELAISGGKTQFFCGPDEAPWIVLFNSFVTFTRLSLGEGSPRRPWGSFLQIAMTSQQLTGENLPSLLSFLDEYREKQCKDHRDKVFGFMGIANQKDILSLGIEVSYERSTTEVYTQLAQAVIQKDNNFNIFGCLGSALPQNGLPSWVPDWTMEDNVSQPLGYSREPNVYSAGGKASPSVTFSPSGKEMISVKNGRMDRPIQIQNATRTDSDGSLDLIHFDPWGRSRLKPLNI